MPKPLLSIFADGVRFDSLQMMPFLSTLNNVPLETVLGYSISCHPSMYTGVYPNKHKISFHWVKSKKKYGPYTPLSFFPDMFPFSNPYFQAVLSHFYAKFFLKKKASPFMGYGKILNLPMKHWHKIEIGEFKYWDEPNYVSDDIKTIFELVRERQIKHHISELHKPKIGKIDLINTIAPDGFDWVYYFVGETDSISHYSLQHSPESESLFKKLDAFIEKQYRAFEKTYGSDGFDFIFWSDHGHIEISNRYNLYDTFRRTGHNLKKFFHIVDSTTARFWPDTDAQKEAIIRTMEQIPEAHLVNEAHMNKLHLPVDKNLYGDLFYYLDGGSIFTHTIHGFGLKTKSMHGYHPDAPGNDGLFVSNKQVSTKKATLPDVFASTIHSLGINYSPKAGLDGTNILS